MGRERHGRTGEVPCRTGPPAPLGGTRGTAMPDRALSRVRRRLRVGVRVAGHPHRAVVLGSGQGVALSVEQVQHVVRGLVLPVVLVPGGVAEAGAVRAGPAGVRAAGPRIGPRAARSAMMEAQAQVSSVITERHNSVINETCARSATYLPNRAYPRGRTALSSLRLCAIHSPARRFRRFSRSCSRQARRTRVVDLTTRQRACRQWLRNSSYGASARMARAWALRCCWRCARGPVRPRGSGYQRRAACGRAR